MTKKRKTRLLVFGLLLATIISLLSGYMVPRVDAAYETFLAYTETDPNSHITVTNNTHATGNLTNNEEAWLSSSICENRFSEDFSHRLDFYFDNSSGGTPSIWALTQKIDDRKGLEDANENFLSVNIEDPTYTNFGYASIGANEQTWALGDDIVGCKFTTPAETTIIPKQIHVYARVTTTDNMKMAIYKNSDLSLICQTGEVSIGTGSSWVTADILNYTSLEASTVYILTCWTSQTLYTRYDAGSASQTVKDDKPYNGFPATYDVDNTYDNKTSIYCSYAVTPTIELEEAYSGSTYTDYANVTYDTWYYLLVNRDEANSNFTLGIYSTDALRNAAGTADVAAVNLTLHSLVDYDYFFAMLSYNAGSSSYAAFQIRNYDLQADYEYVFYGLFDEQTGDCDYSGVNVTAHFAEGTPPTTFYLNDSYTFGLYQKPIYFDFDLVSNRREYWLGTTENTASIYVFNGTTTMYTITFVDLTNVLSDYAYVSCRRQVNGTLRIMEKRRINQDDKIVVALIKWDQYSIYIQDGLAHDYGQIVVTDDTTIILTLTGLEFPTTVNEGYKYLRIWAWRDYSSPNTTKVSYQDLQSYTTNVTMSYYVASNKTQVYTTYVAGSQTFTATWSGANENTTYYVIVTAERSSGDVEYRQVFGRAYSTNPFSLKFLWPSAPFDTNVLLPAFILFCVAGVFSRLNVRVGAIAVVGMAIVLTALFALPITEEVLILAISLAILLGIAAAKRRVILS